MNFQQVEAQKSPTQTLISSSVLHSMGLVFFINYIMWHHMITHEFFNYCRTWSVLQLQPDGLFRVQSDGRADVPVQPFWNARASSGISTPPDIPVDACVCVPDAVPQQLFRSHTHTHTTPAWHVIMTCSIIIVFPPLSCFHDQVKSKSYVTSKSDVMHSSRTVRRLLTIMFI